MVDGQACGVLGLGPAITHPLHSLLCTGQCWVIKGGTLALFLEVKFVPCFLRLIWLVMGTAEGLGWGLTSIRWAH